VLVEEDGEHSIWRDQAQELSLRAKHSEAALLALHHPSGGRPLIRVGGDLRRVLVHDLPNRVAIASREEALDRHETDQRLSIHDCNVFS
jgi:hypothetical protein